MSGSNMQVETIRRPVFVKDGAGRRKAAMAGRVRLATALALAGMSLAGAARAQAPATPAAQVELPVVPFNSSVRVGAEADRRVAWFRKARLGLFIHYGLYAIPGRGEWVRFNESIPQRDYAKLAQRFRTDPGAPAEWAQLASDTGLRYAVLTARHHDGFALFASKANDFNVMATPGRYDVVRGFVDAARAKGIHPGLYYSPLDWRFPGYFMPDLYRESAEAMRDIYHREMAQLGRDYGRIDLIWYDGGGENWLGFGGIDWRGGQWHSRPRTERYRGSFSWQDDRVDATLHAAQPDILINDRTSMPGDWQTREGWGALGDYDDREPWELAVTLAGSWGYTADAQPVSLARLVQMVSRTATRDGNLIINVGPAPDGHVPEAQAARLRELGAWLKVNGSAIYDTRGGPFLPTATTGTTRAGRIVYLHVLPDAQGHYATSVDIPALTGEAKLVAAQALSGGRRVAFRAAGDGRIAMDVPASPATDPVRIVKLTYDRDVMMLKARYAPGMLRAIGYQDGKQVGEWTLQTATAPTRIRLSVDRSNIAADGLDIAYVVAELLDAQGRPVDARSGDRKLTVTVSGAGTLAGVGDGNPLSTESFISGTRTTFQSRAVGVVRSDGHKGPITITVAGENLPAETVTVNADEPEADVRGA